MKEKIIPFDLETAKKIQAGEIKGKVYFKTKLADGSKTYTFNLKSIHCISNTECPYYGVFDCDGEECIQYIESNGYVPEQLVTLIIEVPDIEPQFNPFDKVLVRSGNDDSWEPRLFARYVKYPDKEELYYYTQDDTIYDECIPYEGNEHLVGTTDNPNEE